LALTQHLAPVLSAGSVPSAGSLRPSNEIGGAGAESLAGVKSEVLEQRVSRALVAPAMKSEVLEQKVLQEF
jgi:hypothetical protein